MDHQQVANALGTNKIAVEFMVPPGLRRHDIAVAAGHQFRRYLDEGVQIMIVINILLGIFPAQVDERGLFPAGKCQAGIMQAKLTAFGFKNTHRTLE
jgi:hypothetical protein